MSSSVWQPRTLIVQHEATTPPGLIWEWLEGQGAAVDVLRIDKESPDLDPREYGLIVSLGSASAAYDDTRPFVPCEAKLLRQALDAEVPILGVCFGGQLLARVLGGNVFKAGRPEVGWLPVRTCDPDLVAEGPWFQWHFDTFTLPPGATLLAESDACPQAFVAGRNLGLQFHPEVTPDLMDEWVRLYPHEFEDVGVDPARLLDETVRNADHNLARARRLLDRFRDRIVRREEDGP